MSFPVKPNFPALLDFLRARGPSGLMNIATRTRSRGGEGSVMRRLLSSLCLIVCAGSVAEAQRYGPAPKRPRDASIADSNDARAFLGYGQRIAEQDPDAASAAFYWAARLDPTSGDALYGLAMTRVMRSRTLLQNWFRGGRYNMKSKELRVRYAVKALVLVRARNPELIAR